MKIVSGYVREQKRYSKEELLRLFFRDEGRVDQVVSHFIKSLKACGILKCVKNTDEQKELTDLTDEDIEIETESGSSNNYLYVFTYVGIIIYGNRIIKILPKYILSNYKETEYKIDEKFKQTLKVLEKYHRSKEQIISLFNGYEENRSFNMLGIILYLIKDYYEYGLYSNSEEVIEINGEGQILWEKTINESFALIQNNSPYYTEIYTGKVEDDDKDYFRRLHECILTESSRQLSLGGLNHLFDIDVLEFSEESLDNFGEKDYILGQIAKEIGIQFNSGKQLLLKTLYAYISQEKQLFKEEDGISMFGTTAFHAVWEDVCAEVLNNQLKTPLEKLNLSMPLVNGYFDFKKDNLINIIEKPIWQDGEIEKRAKETLRPDIISLMKCDGEDIFIIFDAKYYNLQLEKGKDLRGYPGVGDVTKQYLYQLAYKKFLETHNIKQVKNCFLMPTEKNEVVIKGVAKLPMLEDLGLENIQIRLIPTELFYKYYLKRKRIDIALLRL